MYKAELISGDFEDNTITFEIEGEMTLRAGDYVILAKEEFEKNENELIDLRRYCQEMEKTLHDPNRLADLIGGL